MTLDDSALAKYGDKKIVDRIQTRKLYKIIGDEKVKTASDPDFIAKLQTKLQNALKQDGFVKKFTLHRGKKEKDPVDHVQFYNAEGPTSVEPAPIENMEIRVRAFVRDARKKSEGRTLFKKFFKEMKDEGMFEQTPGQAKHESKLMTPAAKRRNLFESNPSSKRQKSGSNENDDYPFESK